MTNGEAIKELRKGMDISKGEEYKAFLIAISALSTLDMIRSIINLPHIQEDVMRYKMICEVVDKHTKGEAE